MLLYANKVADIYNTYNNTEQAKTKYKYFTVKH